MLFKGGAHKLKPVDVAAMREVHAEELATLTQLMAAQLGMGSNGTGSSNGTDHTGTDHTDEGVAALRSLRKAFRTFEQHRDDPATSDHTPFDLLANFLTAAAQLMNVGPACCGFTLYPMLRKVCVCVCQCVCV